MAEKTARHQRLDAYGRNRPIKGRHATLEPTDEQRKSGLNDGQLRHPHKEIALTVINARTERPIDDMTLRAAFRQSLTSAMRSPIRWRNRCSAGQEGNVTAAIWWKARMGWKRPCSRCSSTKMAIPLDQVFHLLRAP
jgi:hypothetical protein